ncbi:MAG: hypothetical protein V2G43_03865 [bacterium JZ-2024 1]
MCSWFSITSPNVDCIIAMGFSPLQRIFLLAVRVFFHLLSTGFALFL